MGEKSDDMRIRHEQTYTGHSHTAEPGHVKVTDQEYSPGSERDRELDALRAEIERTRFEMSETFSAIQARLSPEHLKAQAREKVREATIGRAKGMAGQAGRKARGMRHTILEKVKDNPLPAALIGLGVSWLLAGARSSQWEEDGRYVDHSHGKRSRRYGYGEYGTTDRESYTIGRGEVLPEGYYGTYEGSYGRGPEYRSESESARHDYGRDVEGARDYGREKTHEAMDRIRDTAGSVQERASHMTGQARETAGHYADMAGEKATQFTSQTREKAEHLTSQAREKAEHLTSQAREKAGHLTSQAREKAEHYTHQARERAEHFGSQARESVDRFSHRASEMGVMARERAVQARSEFVEVMHDNPMIVVLGMFALGAAVGLSIPETRREDEMMGDIRDDLLERAQEAGRQTIDRVQHAASEVGRAAKEEAERQHLTGDELMGKAEQVASKAGETAKKEAGQTAREAGQAVKETARSEQGRQENRQQTGETAQKETRKPGASGTPGQREAKNQGLVE